MTAKRRLTNIKTLEVSLVDKGAVKRTFLIMKGEQGVDKDSLMEKINKSKVLKELHQGLTELEPEALKKALVPLLKSESNIDDLLLVLKNDMPGDFMSGRSDDFETDINKLGNEAFGLVRAMANMLNDFLSRGVKPGDSTFMPEVPPMVEKSLTTEEISALPQNVQDHLKAMADQNAKLTTQVNDVEKSLTEIEKKFETVEKAEEEVDLYAGLSAVQKAHQQKLETKLALLEKAADEVNKKEYVAKAEALNLPELDSASFGVVLKEIGDSCSPESTEAVLKALASAGDIISKAALMEPVGSDGEPVTSDSETQLNALAKTIADDKGCTFSVALVKALEQRPDLYNG